MTDEACELFIRVVFVYVALAVLEATEAIQNAKYLKEVLNFIRNLLVNYYPSFLDREPFARVIDDLLDESAPIYSRVSADLLEEVNLDSEQFTYMRVRQEASWRSGLEVGDSLDAISHYKTPNSGVCHYIAGW